MPSVSLSVGRITACWFALRSLERLGGQATRGICWLTHLEAHFVLVVYPFAMGYVWLSRAGSLNETQDRLHITEIGSAALAITNEDEPNPRARRFLITRLLLADPPPWVAYWQGDPDTLQYVLPGKRAKDPRVSGLLPKAETSDDLDSWAFWRALNRVPLMSETAATSQAHWGRRRTFVGEFERQRLTEDGHPDLAAQVQWLARESDAYGFDILSFMGGHGPDADTRIAIEVKATSLPRSAANYISFSAYTNGRRAICLAIAISCMPG